MTMDCMEFRRAAGADPRHLSVDAAAHGESCAKCAELLRSTLELDEKILAALRVPVPERAPARVSRLPVIERRRFIALAASIVAGVLVGSLLWVSGPRASLADDLVRHMGHEPGAMTATANAADPAKVAAVLARAGVALRPGIGVVSYASTCRFRGQQVPHLVVQTAAGPVTVMVLRNDPVARPVNFDEDGYAGTILPAGPGSVAVIGHAPVGDLDQVADQLRNAVEWIRK
jgi:hypothetical protein